MQIVVPPIKKIGKHQRYGESSSPCLASPLLETPYAFPSYITCDTNLVKTQYSPPVFTYDQHLTDLLKAHTHGIFSEHVEYVSKNDGSNVPIINCYNSADAFAIGARTELLHNRFDIGPLLLTILSHSPLWIMTPEEIESYVSVEVDSYHPSVTRDMEEEHRERTSGLFPDWITCVSTDVPKGLPYNLSVLINECLTKMDREFEHSFEYDEYEITSWPVATCSWYGFEPYRSRVTWKLLCDQQYKTGCPPDARVDGFKTYADQSQGTDPSWMALDRMIEDAQNHTHATCVRQHHEPTAIEDDIAYFGPFAQLLNYLSHARIEN